MRTFNRNTQNQLAIFEGKSNPDATMHTENFVLRTLAINARQRFTDSLKAHGIEQGHQYAMLTNEMYRCTFGISAKAYKEKKALKKSDSLRDNMSPMELATIMFSEVTTTELLKQSGAKGYKAGKAAIQKAGKITQEALKRLEQETGQQFVFLKE